MMIDQEEKKKVGMVWDILRDPTMTNLKVREIFPTIVMVQEMVMTILLVLGLMNLNTFTKQRIVQNINAVQGMCRMAYQIQVMNLKK